MTTLTKYQQHLIDWAKSDAADKRNDWPGFPLTQIPLEGTADMHALIRMGLLEIVEVESKIRVGRVNSYVVAV